MPAELLGNATVLTFGEKSRVISSGAVLVDGDRIVEVGPTATLRHEHSQASFIDLGGAVLMPGLICAHTHLYGALARGMPMGEAPATFPEILQKVWWRLDKLLTLKAVQVSAEVLLVDAIRNGCTTIVDHHSSPNDVDGSLDVIAEATLAAGVRACLAYEASDRDGKIATKDALTENQRFIKYCKKAKSSALAASFGLHAAFTLSDKTLDRAATAAGDVGFHVHVSEDPVDSGAVHRLAKAGILGPKTIAAHCVHVTKKEQRQLEASGTNVVHNFRSNMNNAVGLPPRLARPGLGNDGFSMDMLQELKFAYLAPKLQARDPRVGSGEDVLRMAFTNNAEIVRRLWEPFGIDLRVGAIEPGCYADLAVLDYWAPTPLNTANLAAHVLFGMAGGQVRSTIAGGRWLMRDRKLLTLDEQDIAANARDQAAKLWKRLKAA